jgi:membrane-associated phospholipid phosphatase
MKTVVLMLSIGLLGWWSVVVPLQIIVAALALAQDRVRLAVFSLAAVSFAVAAVGAARIVVERYPDQAARLGVVLPSGHSALVVVLVTTLAAMVGRDRPRLRAIVAGLTILAVACVMVRGGHTPGDVAVGLGLGGLSVLVAYLLARWRRTPALSPQ